MLTEVLGWPQALIKTEPHVEKGYIDYLLFEGDRSLALVEAKRSTVILTSTANLGKGVYKASGPAMKDAIEAISQVETYAIKSGAPLACITNGFEWLAHWFIRGDGKSPANHKIITFPSLDAVEKDFAAFYDLFSYNAIKSKTYKARFNQEEGSNVLSGERLRPIRDPNGLKILDKSEISRDLSSIFKAFFSSMSGDNDPEMLARCFVETKESKDAEASMQKIAKNLIDNIEMMPTNQTDSLQRNIKDAVERNAKEFALIVGNKGAGKSTFIDKFFELTLDKNLRNKCLVLKVDLRDSNGNLDKIQTWLTNQLVTLTEQALFPNKILDYEDLQGVFHKQYQQWAQGEFKPLYNTDKNAFKLKFGEYIHQIKENDKDKYLTALLWHATGARKLMPCLIYDNTDHYPQSFQDAVFQYAQSLYRASFSFVICPITDRTIWQLSKSGPLQSYDSKVFYLPVPSTKEVLGKRIEFIKTKTALGEQQSEQYLLSKGIRLSIKNLTAFIACVEEVFITTEYVSRTISWLCNFDIRRSLLLTQKVLSSPHISIDDLVKTYLSGSSLKINELAVRKAIMLGDYNLYDSESSEYVLNMFSIFADLPSSPLIRLSILQVLKDKEVMNDEAELSYMKVSEIEEYLDPMGCSPFAVRKHLEKLLKYRCIEPYDPTESTLTDSSKLKITSSGLMHIEFTLGDRTYIEQVGLTTEVRESRCIDELRGLFLIRNIKPEDINWHKAATLFAEYCVDQDLVFGLIPTTYSGQLRIRHEFSNRWAVN